MYIDTSNAAAGRVCLNAQMADQLRTARTIKLTGDATGSASFNGTADASIAVDIPALDDLGEAIDTKATVGHGIYYGTCATDASTVAKVATLTDATGFKLATGSVVIIKFTNANSASKPTLNVNGTGAKAIMQYGSTNVSTSSSTSGWIAGAVTVFVYDGTNWVRDYWSNSTYSLETLGQGYGTCSTAAATTAKVVTLTSFKLKKNGIVSVKFTNAVPASATMNINSTGAKAIYYKGAAIKAGVISAGDTATFIYDNTQYHLIAIDDLTLSDMGITATKEEINKLTDSIMTTTELNYLSGVTSNIQTQLNTLNTNKLDKTANAVSATKLQTSRKIKLTGDAEGEASFNGTADASIAVEIPDLDTLGDAISTINSSLNKEAYLTWGDKNLVGSVSPVDMAASYLHSANRFQFAKPAGITVEYSRDNGATYTDYGASDSSKIGLVSGIGASLTIGKRSGTTSSVTVNTVQDQLRITLNATNMGIYTSLQKLLINITTNYAKGSQVKIEKAMKGSETTFSTVGTYSISGWSGWNSIPIRGSFGGGSTQTSNIAVLRLTFFITGVTSGNYNNALTVLDIIGLGDTYWAYNSNMAKTGHLYSWDASQNATFPANINITKNLVVSGTGSITGNTTIGGTLGVTGAATFGNTISTGADITTDGSISAEGSIHAEGNLSTPNASIQTNGYITGTWLRTTSTSNSAGNIATISNGWIYYRTPAQTLNDIIEAEGTLDLNPSGDTPLAVISDTAAASYIQYKGSGGTSLGYIGFSAANTPTVYLNTGAKKIFHEGNLTLSSLGITATKEEINVLKDSIMTTDELNYLSGVTSNIQTQLNGKLPLTGGTLTGNLFIQGSNPYVGFKNSEGTTKGYVQYVESTDSYGIGASMAKSLNISSTGSLSIPASQTITPGTTNTGTIGTSDKKWNAMYATSFVGNASSATILQTVRTINGMSFNGSVNVTNYGVCDTVAATAAKTVTVGSTFVLATGAQVVIKFTNSNSVASPTLNVNSTGAKPIVMYGTTATNTETTTNGWVAGAVQTFTYDGTSWVRDYWYNTTYTTRPITQTVTTTDAEYPLLSRTTTAVTTSNGHARFAAGVTLNPSTNTITATTFNGNATTASKLATAHTITLAGDLSGAAKFDGSGDITISAAVLDDSHNHTIANVDNLQTNLDGKLSLTGGTMTGIITFKNTTATPAAGTILPCIKGSFQNGDGTYYTINMMDLVGTAETTNAYSAYMRVGSSNGATFVTSGESSLTMPAAITAGGGGAENLYLTSDGTIDFFVACANDAASYTNAFTMTSSKVTSHLALYGAVWNDYAEYRDQKEKIQPGYCVVSADNGQVSKTTEKFQACDGIVSDTFGFAIGETDECKTPLAVAGRVLAYCFGDKYSYHAGDTVCAGPNGLVYKMTREEIKEYPDRIVGIVSEIPEYEIWGTGKTEVNGRIWIKVR